MKQPALLIRQITEEACILTLPDQDDIIALKEAMRILPFENKVIICQGNSKTFTNS